MRENEDFCYIQTGKYGYYDLYRITTYILLFVGLKIKRILWANMRTEKSLNL
jgi:hypothetical protein